MKIDLQRKEPQIARCIISSKYVRNVNLSDERDVLHSEQGEQRCRSVQISRCGVRLLRRILRIKEDVCNNINYYIDCNSRSLPQPDTIDIDAWLFNQSDMRGCVKKRTPVPVEQYRNRLSSVHDPSCCSEGINKCTMKIFQEFAEYPRNCSKIETYGHCMEEVTKQCFRDILFDLNLPFIISRLKNTCRRAHRMR
ncbi:hypothetical protein CHS0354_024698 [Potamilus streckersoni]|uniref:Uncharacterized protein n=1 Tax=Potamilus streckersoni TaxID=2493646 RepID=A0AAE0RX65_9BIVA|nr:hypothetical protein CHS0354_024698 [Potamilus streckersoni]